MSTAAPSAVTRAECLLHPMREAAARCVSCGRSYCRECVTALDRRMYCAACFKEKTGVKQKRKRDWFLVTTLAQFVIGLFGLWLTAYILGRTLAEMPTGFHEGTIWERMMP